MLRTNIRYSFLVLLLACSITHATDEQSSLLLSLPINDSITLTAEKKDCPILCCKQKPVSIPRAQYDNHKELFDGLFTNTLIDATTQEITLTCTEAQLNLIRASLILLEQNVIDTEDLKQFVQQFCDYGYRQYSRKIDASICINFLSSVVKDALQVMELKPDLMPALGITPDGADTVIELDDDTTSSVPVNTEIAEMIKPILEHALAAHKRRDTVLGVTSLAIMTCALSLCLTSAIAPLPKPTVIGLSASSLALMCMVAYLLLQTNPITEHPVAKGLLPLLEGKTHTFNECFDVDQRPAGILVPNLGGCGGAPAIIIIPAVICISICIVGSALAEGWRTRY